VPSIDGQGEADRQNMEGSVLVYLPYLLYTGDTRKTLGRSRSAMASVRYYGVCTVLRRLYGTTASVRYYGVCTVLRRLYGTMASVRYYGVCTVLL
jgi:hypothetical protein